MTSPTQRSLAMLRKEKWFCAVVEHWNAHINCRQDLYGFADLICFRGDEVRLVQTTSGPNVAARVEKIQHIPAAAHWLESRYRTIHVHGWRKVGQRGTRKLWDCRVVEITPFGVPMPELPPAQRNGQRNLKLAIGTPF